MKEATLRLMDSITCTRRALVQALSAGLGLALVSPRANARAREAHSVALPAFRVGSDRDDNLALRRALETGRPVHLPAGAGSGPRGVYLIGTEDPANNLVDGANIFGDGIGLTVVRKPPASHGYVFFCDSGSSNPSRNLTGIRLEAMTIEDDVVNLGFSEHQHLVHVNGVTRLAVHDVEFRGFRGDGFYLGSSVRRDGERHNREVTISGCRFDGVNRNNRNGITVIDGDGVTIERCHFFNCTRGGDGTTNYPRTTAQLRNPEYGLAMPGAIDCEPDPNRFAIIRNIRILNCHFANGGGAAVALLLPSNRFVNTPIQGITIADCTMERQRLGITCFGYADREAIEHPIRYEVSIENNALHECDTPFIINGMRGLRLSQNVIADCAGAAELGYTAYNHDCALIENRFERVGYSRQRGANGLLIRFADTVVLEGNHFVDCGPADGAGGRAINFVAGTISNFRLIRNRFESPTGRTTYAIGVDGAVIDRGSSTAHENVYTFATNRDFG